MSNQLDDFFKNKLQDRSFDYDNSAWEDARLLIDADERRKKKRFFFYLLAGFSILMFVGTSAYYLGMQSAVPSEMSKFKTSPNQEKIVDEKEIIANADNNTSINASDETMAYLDQALLADKSIMDVSLPGRTAEKNRKVTHSSRTIQNSTLPTRTNKKNSFNLSNAQGVASSTTTVYNSTTIVTNPNIVTLAAPKLSEYQNDTFTAESKTDLTTLPLLSLPTFGTSKAELSLEHTKASISPESLPNENPSGKFFFGLRSGLVLVPLQFRDAEAGFELGYQINRNWAISVQPKYQYQSLAQTVLAKSEIKEFGFGLRSSAFNLQAETVRSIHVPIMLSYLFGNKNMNLTDEPSSRYLKNKISAGIAYVVIDGITGSIYQNEAAGQSSVFQSGYLSADTFNRHNAEVMIGYERYLSPRFSIGLQARYRLRDQFTDAFTNLNQDIISPSAFYFGLQASYKLF